MKRNQYNAYEVPGVEVSAPLLDFGKPETPNAIEMLGQILDAKLPGWRDVVGRAQVKPQGKPRNEFSEFGRAFKEHATDYGWVPELAKGAATTGLGAMLGQSQAWDQIGGAMDVAPQIPGAMAREFGRSWREEGPGATLGGIAGDIAQPGPGELHGMAAIRTPRWLGGRKPEFPGVYKRADDIIAEAEAARVPDPSNMKAVWGADSEDLMDEFVQGQGQLGSAPALDAEWTGEPKKLLEGVTGRANASRYAEVLEKAFASPLLRPSVAWYNLNPKFRRLVQLVGVDEAHRIMRQRAALNAAFSPQTAVPVEHVKASHAAYALRRLENGDPSLWEAMLAHAGTNPGLRPSGPLMDQLIGMPGTMGFPGRQLEYAREFGTNFHPDRAKPRLKSDQLSPKTPTYMGHMLPEYSLLGLELPGYSFADQVVPDAHQARSLGIPDARPEGLAAEKRVASLSNTEAAKMWPWIDRVSRGVGLRSGLSQPLAWVTYGRQTGVDSPLMATRLAIETDLLNKYALSHGVDPSNIGAMQRLRDLELLGQMPLSIARKGKP